MTYVARRKAQAGLPLLNGGAILGYLVGGLALPGRRDFEVQHLVVISMLDMNMFREHADLIRADHTKRGLPHDAIERVIELDKTWRNLLHETDQLRRAKNEAARGIGAAKSGRPRSR